MIFNSHIRVAQLACCWLLLNLDQVAFCQRYTSPIPVTALAIAPDRSKVVIGSQAGLQILSFPTLEKLARCDTGLVNVNHVRFSLDGKQLILAGGTPGENGRMEVWSWPELKLRTNWQLHDDLIYHFDLSADGQSLVTASADGTCVICDWSTGEVQTKFSGHSNAVLTVQFLDGHRVLSAGVDQTIRVWTADSGTLQQTFSNHVATVNRIKRFELRGSNRPEVTPQISSQPQGTHEVRLLSTGQDRTVRLWNPANGRMIRFARLSAIPVDVDALPGDSLVAIACEDGTVQLLDLVSLESKGHVAVDLGFLTELRLVVGDRDETMLLVAGEKGLSLITEIQ